ncbi:odv-ec27 [Oxyplax ochracea nucleopolyhedrovirus]|uniref:Odv-ec27 n=1 Tax=Oxyplax ochracea nucleopolyhedrovirus TaxID=2083176 RepID=A0A2L0WTZ2_9ABAC|nr:odv-ec27 [Oxyplax ochracea nucleopolyhedrovirus]AVA31111.1 odv-ec27 [Oxyplax ochracea nucleopolyhedrovirus]
MKRVKCNKIRTVTEIVNSDDKLQKTFDASEFDLKNLNSLESYETLKIKLVLVKYMAMLSTLETTKPILEIFKDRTNTIQIAAVVLSTLGFIHNRFYPLITHFNNNMEFVIVESDDARIPGEPVLFTENKGVILCSVDRRSIVKMLSREFDTETEIDCNKENSNVRIAKILSVNNDDDSYSRKRLHDELSDFSITEIETTQYLTLLLIMEHAYLHYHIFTHYDAFEYSKSLVDHSLFSNKLRSTAETKMCNLLLSKFNFSIEDYNKINQNSLVTGFNILNFNK